MIRILLLGLLFFTISGCQKFHEIQVKYENNKLVFYSDEIMATCTNGIIISDFGVQYIGKKSGAIAWKLVRDFDTIFDTSSYDLPLIYGDSIKNIKTVVSAIELMEGKYNFGGTVLCKMKSDDKSILVNGIFLIDKTGRLSKNS